MRRISGVVRMQRSRARSVATPLANVVVSTDAAACVTDDDGRYTLPVADTDRFVKITTPSGMRADGPWFYDLHDASEEGPMDFMLVEDAARASDSCRFIQITDLHTLRRGPSTPELVREDVARVAASWADRADFIVLTGDIAGAAAVEDLASARLALTDLPLPVFWLPGNHDLPNDRHPGPYADVFGPDSYSFDWGPLHFVAYNSITDAPDSAGRRWLQRDLSLVPPNKPSIFLTHYQMDAAFFKELQPFRVVAGISGHWHSSRLYHDGRTVHFTTPSFGFGGIDYSPRCYRVFSWSDGTLEAKTYGLLPDDAGGVSAATGYSFRAGACGDATREDAGQGKDELVPVEWPQHAGGAARVNRVHVEHIGGVEPVWRTPLPGGLHMAAPVVHGGRLFVGLLDEDRPRGGRVICLDAATGAALWTASVGESVKHSLAAADGRVVGATVTGEIFALAADSGRELWRRNLHDPSRRWVYSAPLIVDETVYAGSGGHFVALDARTGDVLWERRDLSTDDWMSSYVSPVFDAATGAVITGFFWQRLGLLALDAADGATRWVHEGPGPHSAVSTPAVAEEALYVLRVQGALQKVDPRTGDVIWHAEGPAQWSPATPVPAGERVYVASGDGRVLAVGADDGTVVWDRELPEAWSDVAAFRRRSAAALATPLLMGEVLWVPGADGVLYGLDPVDGAVRVEHRVGTPLLSAPVPAADGLYIADTSGCIHGLRLIPEPKAAR